MGVEIPLSVLYSLPAVPVFIFGWFSQVSADRRVCDLTDVDAKIVADKALLEYLKSADLEDVEIVKSDNYMQNEYVESDNKIYLSPDATQHSDVASVAFALRAGAQAKIYRTAPQKTAFHKTLHKAETVAFWLAFTVLAFGLMASNWATALVGYVLGAVVFGIWGWRTRLLFEIDSLALTFAEKKLDRTAFENVKKVLAAERRKF